MRWKEWPYWAKGGIVFLILSVVLGIFDYICLINNWGLASLKCVPIQLYRIIASPVSFLFFDAFPVSNQGIKLWELSIILTSVTLWTVVGILIGLLYGKIKKP